MIAFLFVGQGSQKPGMAASLLLGSRAARAVFDQAEEWMPGLTKLCTQGTQEMLDDTRVSQNALFTMDVAAARALEAEGIRAQATAGFSLGEYAALVQAGMLSFQDAFMLVKQRALVMHEAAMANPGGMAALMGGSSQKVEQLCEQVDGFVAPVNYNCPGQTVIAGDDEALQQAMSAWEASGGRAIRLRTQGAFHSVRMKSAADALEVCLSPLNFQSPCMPIYSNVTGQAYDNDPKDLLVRQVMSPVRWEETIRALIASGVQAFAECGPGGVLAGLCKRIDRSIPCYRVEDMETWQVAAEALKNIQ